MTNPARALFARHNHPISTLGRLRDSFHGVGFSCQILIAAVCILSIPSVPHAEIGKHSDVAPLPEEMVASIIESHIQEQPLDTYLHALDHELKQTRNILVEIRDKFGPVKNLNETSIAQELATKRMLLRGQDQKFKVLEKEIEKVLQSQPPADWDSERIDGLIKSSSDRFTALKDALQAAITARSKPQLVKSTDRAQALIAEYAGMRSSEEPTYIEIEIPGENGRTTTHRIRQSPQRNRRIEPLRQPVPTLRQDLDLEDVEEKSKPAPPPAYTKAPRAPTNMYASVQGIMMADAAPTPPEAQSCNYAPSDLAADGIEIKFTQEIKNLAKLLDYSPAKIFEWVSQNIAFEPYYGSLKGAEATLVSGRGNATDQASLMVALLRASKIPARYVKGRVRFNDDRIQKWLGVKSMEAARSVLRAGGIPATGGSNAVSYTHVWVQACIPYGNYRGTGFDNTGHRWIPLDPSFEDKEYRDGIIVDMPLDYSQYLSERRKEMPQEYFIEEQVSEAIKSMAPRYANNTVEDVGYVGRKKPQKIDILPSTLPYQVTEYLAWGMSNSAEVAQLPLRHRYSVRIEVGENGSDGVVSEVLPNIALSRITFSYKQGTASSTQLVSKAKANLLDDDVNNGDVRGWIDGPYSSYVDTGRDWIRYRFYGFMTYDTDGNLRKNPGYAIGVRCFDRVPVIRIEGNAISGSLPSSSIKCFLFSSFEYDKSDLDLTIPSFDDWFAVSQLKQNLKLSVVFGENTETESVANSVSFNNIAIKDWYALHAYAFQASDRLISNRVDILKQNIQTYPDPSVNSTSKELVLGEFLHIVGLKYMRYIEDAGKEVGRLLGQSGWSGNHLGLTSSRSDVSYLFDLPLGVKNSGFLIDVPGGISRNRDIETGEFDPDAFLLFGYAASAYESYIWQENARMDAVSSVSGLQFANDTGIPVLSITASNKNTQLPKLQANSDSTLNYSDQSVNTLESLADSGYAIQIPRRLLDIEGWKGQVYIATRFDSKSANAQFAIGPYAGGYTYAPPRKQYFSDHLAFDTGWRVPNIYRFFVDSCNTYGSISSPPQ